MIRLNMGLKSALLAVTMLVAVPTGTTKGAAAPAASNAIVTFIGQHKVKFVIAAIIYAMDTRLNTRPKADFSMDDLKGDFQELLDSLNIFDTKLYKQLLFLFDKYVIGLKVKIDPASQPVKDENGVTKYTLKTKKLTQKPFGLYGLFDAYVLTNAKKFTTETLTAAAGLYVFLNAPYALWNGEVNNKAKSLKIEVAITE